MLKLKNNWDEINEQEDQVKPKEDEKDEREI
jgi:hypothetical protein